MPTPIEADEPNGAKTLLSADRIVIATGTRPYHPPDVDFDHPRIFDSDTILDLNDTPQSITVYGAGVIGCEYTSMLRNLGVKVNLINTRDKLLEFLDDEIIDALSYHLRDQGVLLRHNEAYERIEPRDDGVVLHLKSGKQLKTDILLWANGRTGNSDDMGLEAIGIQPDHRGLIAVDEYYQTAVPHIYAVGDVIGFPSLASASYVQGRFAATHALTGDGRSVAGPVDSDRHLHQPRNQFDRQDRTAIDRGKSSLRDRPRVVQEPGPGANHGPDRGHAQAVVSSRNAANPWRSLLWTKRLGDHPHRSGDHVANRFGQFALVFHQHHVQLSDHGRSLSRGGAEWV